jgi:GNAT superfamily N-acetyltransferase
MRWQVRLSARSDRLIVGAVIDVVEISAAQTHPLRSRVLGWPEPRSRLDQGSASHLAVTDGGTVVAVVSHISWPCPGHATTPARYFWAMAVEPKRQRHGYGRRLLATIADRARIASERLVWADARDSAVPFYVACGARVAAEPAYIDEVTGLLDRRVEFFLDDDGSNPPKCRGRTRRQLSQRRRTRTPACFFFHLPGRRCGGILPSST